MKRWPSESPAVKAIMALEQEGFTVDAVSENYEPGDIHIVIKLSVSAGPASYSLMNVAEYLAGQKVNY